MSWEGPRALGNGWASLSLVDGTFWSVGKTSYASKDGFEWTPLPKAIPDGKILQTSKGTLLSIDGRRDSILRSTDGGESWAAVHEFEGVEGANGLADIVEGRVKKAPAVP